MTKYILAHSVYPRSTKEIETNIIGIYDSFYVAWNLAMKESGDGTIDDEGNFPDNK